MEAKKSGLQVFRESLYIVAARTLQEKHPKYFDTFVNEFTNTKDISRSLNAVKSINTDKVFAKWRPLLTSTLDTELAINRIQTNLYLLSIIPPKRINPYQDIVISEGKWVDYHVVAWIFLIDALLERVKKLVTQSVRVTIKPYNSNYQSIQNEILEPVEKLLRDLRDRIRNALAHGGWAVDAPAEERLWEGLVLAAKIVNNYGISFDQAFETTTKYHSRWQGFLVEKSNIVLNSVDRAMNKLNGYINWNILL